MIKHQISKNCAAYFFQHRLRKKKLLSCGVIMPSTGNLLCYTRNGNMDRKVRIAASIQQQPFCSSEYKMP